MINKFVTILVLYISLISHVFSETITCPKSINCNYDEKACYSDAGKTLDEWVIQQNGDFIDTSNEQWTLGSWSSMFPSTIVTGNEIKNLEHPKGITIYSCYYTQTGNKNSQLSLSRYVNHLIGSDWDTFARSFSQHSKYCKTNNPDECAAIK